MAGTVKVARRSRPWDRLPISKGRSSGQAAFRPVGKLSLSKREKRLADFLAEISRRIPTDLWDTSLTSADIRRAEAITAEVLGEFERQIAGALLDQYEASAEKAGKELAALLSREFRQARKSVTKAAPDPATLAASFRFDARNPESARWANERAARLVTNMAATQREMIRQVVAQAYEFQRTPQQTARALYDVLSGVSPGTTAGQEFADLIGARVNGLTVRYEQAVVNRAAQLADDLDNRGITGTKALTRIREDADKYADRLRRSRARTIARTEILTANNAGRFAAFEQAKARGLLSEQHSKKRWSASGFDMCPICTSLDGQLQPMSAPFVDEVSVDFPPAHPNCRCSFDIEPNVQLWEPPEIIGDGTSDDPFRWATDPKPTPRFRQGAATRLPDRRPPSTGTAGQTTPQEPSGGQGGASLARFTAEQRRQAEEFAPKYGITPDETLMFLEDVPAFKSRAIAEANDEVFAIHGLLDQSNFGSFALPDPRDVGAGQRAYYDWFQNLDPKEKARLRSNGWLSRTARTGADEWDAALANQFGMESRGQIGEALEEHWLRLNRDYDILKVASRQLRRPRSFDRYGGTPDYNRLFPRLRSEGYDMNVVIGGFEVEIAAMIGQRQLLGAADEAAALLREADIAVHGAPPWRMSYMSWEDEVRTLEYEKREFGLSRIDEERLQELIPPRVDVGQDYEELYATIIETARFARFEVADYANIPWA